MSTKFLTAPSKRLSETITGASTSFKLNNILGWDGTALSSADFGTRHWASFRNSAGTRMELMEFDPTTVTSASSAITIVKRGLEFDGDQVTETSANKLTWIKGDTIVELGSHIPQLLANTVLITGDQTIAGVKTFSSSPVVPTPVNPTDAVNKNFAESLAFSGASDASTTVKGLSRLSTSPNTSLGTVTMTIATPCVVSLTAHGLTLNDSIVFTTTGALPSGLSTSTTYYVIAAGLTADAFQISTTLLGTALNTSGSQSGVHTLYKTTPVSVAITDTKLPTQAENDALAGTSGSPSSSNKYVTNDDTSTSGASGKVVRLNGTAYPAADGSAITGVDVKAESYTASGAIDQNDSVYISATNTVKSLYPSAQGTGTSVSTTATNSLAMRSLSLSTNGLYLSISGGDKDNSGGLTCQVRTMNAAESDFSNGTSQDVYITSNGCNGYDVKSIGTDKFMFIFQANTGGAGAGIKTCVITVSGTTVTVGAITTIETTGSLGSLPSIAKLDTDKALIFYKKDSDSKLYCQVLTVSGTTITTNTPVNVNNSLTLAFITQAVQLGTDSTAIVYGDGAGAGAALYGRTISVSGTTPTVNAEQTLVTQASSSWRIGLQVISATKLLLAYSENTSTTNDQLCHIALSGATMTKSSNIALSAQRGTNYFGFSTIGTKYALILDSTSATTATLFLVNISGTAPVQISTQTLTSLTNSGNRLGYAIVKVSPWTYTAKIGNISAGEYIVKLTPLSSYRIAIAQSAIADTASGNVLIRYKTQTLSGITLTPATIYYVDDTGQPTTNSSLTAPTLGISINTTKILLQ